MENHPYKNKIISGVQLSQAIQNTVKEKLDLIMSANKNLLPPKLKVILVGDKEDSKVYVENKLKLCKSLGVEGEVKLFDQYVTKEELLQEVVTSNKDDTIHGIIVQLPLPNHIPKVEILACVDVKKDVDGLNPINLGKLLQMNINECLLPPTAMGVLEMLRLAIEYKNNINDYIEGYLNKHVFDDQPVDLAGLDVTVVGRGLTAGLPLSILMQKCNATVTMCHSYTKDISRKSKYADIVISAVGKRHLITSDMINNNSIIVDVGINVHHDDNDKRVICGDVDFDGLIDQSKYITPVPGGVGRMTVVMLLKNLVKAWGDINNIDIKKF